MDARWITDVRTAAITAVAGRLPGRASPEARTALVFAGVGLADVAVGAAVYQRAAEKGIGRVLPL
jgi:ornithine cyclodeaminase/alanine dehydrogenase-like protein (mu-crystallin family)